MIFPKACFFFFQVVFMKIHWKEVLRDDRRACKYSWHPTPVPQDTRQAVVLCSRTSVTLLVGFFFYHKHLLNITQNNVYLFISVLKVCALLWDRMFVLQKWAAAKALAVSSKHWEAFASQSVLSLFQYH